jgi:hypothetical protein
MGGFIVFNLLHDNIFMVGEHSASGGTILMADNYKNCEESLCLPSHFTTSGLGLSS